MIIITFALPDESRAFVQRLSRPIKVDWGENGESTSMIHGKLAGRDVLVVHTGVGPSEKNKSRLRALLQTGTPLGEPANSPEQNVEFVIASGFAGGLHHDLKVGDLILADNVSDEELLEELKAHLYQEGFDENLMVGSITTQPLVAESVATKSALATHTKAVAVDMETSWIAAICEEFAVPVVGLRVISDSASQRMPIPSSVMFDTFKQRPRYCALPLYLLRHPSRISPFLEFVRGLAPARNILSKALESYLEATVPVEAKVPVTVPSLLDVEEEFPMLASSAMPLSPLFHAKSDLEPELNA